MLLWRLLHFLELRMAPNAQYEIRQYANVIGHEIVSKWVPITWEAFLDYRFNAINLSSTEIRLLSLLNKHDATEAMALMQKMDMISPTKEGWKPNLEAREIATKLERLGISVPWTSEQQNND